MEQRSDDWSKNLDPEDLPYGSADPFLGHSGMRKRPRSQLTDITVSIVVPWLVFFLVLCLFIFLYHDMQVVVLASISVCAALALLFLILGCRSWSSTYVAIGLLSFISVVAGSAVGLWLNREYLTRYWELDAGIEYKDVNPTLDSRKTSDAGIIHFTNDSFVDDRRTIGFVAKGTIFCVAPVVRLPRRIANIEYWAIGEDCCEQRANFDCGFAREPGIVTSIVQRPSQVYLQAVEQAASVYHLNTSRTPRLVSFAGDPKVVISDIWDETLTIALLALIMDLCVCTVTGLVLGKVLTPRPQQSPLLARN